MDTQPTQSPIPHFPSNRATLWQLRTKQLRLDALPLMMGIVNVTPDSFSDGGKFFSTQRAVEHALRLVEEGADILDIGGESTRPNAESVPVEEELRRVLPVVSALAKATDVVLSVDTSKAIVASAALEAGAEIINDVTGLNGDPDMLTTVVRYQPGICIMHMQGSPQTMQINPHYDNVIMEITQYLAMRRDAITAAGIMPDRICLDPGIGFGKSHHHNLELLRNAAEFHRLGCPLLYGHSRKGIIAHILQDSQRDRLAGGIGIALALAQQGIQILRVHDVRPTKDACRSFAASGGHEHFS